MNLQKTKNGYYVEKNDFFKPELFFDCGQSFRFSKNGTDFVGVAFGAVMELTPTKTGYNITTSKEIDEYLIADFFDLKRDYNEVEKVLYNDEVIRPALQYGRGIRILKQEFFETLLTFIYSQRSNIPKISKCVNETARLFGTPIEYNNTVFYAFPTPKQMKNITEERLSTVKCGYRSPYILDAVSKVSSGEITYENLIHMDYQKAKETLMTIKGVGEKVADCVCLFSLGFFEAFPTDTWIKKAMDKLYNISENQIKDTSKTLFENYCGIAQQFLFYYLKYKKD